ncbi:putative candidate secreted effector protein [Blumeria hordei DH14]|uniref:Putative candidate secreted effector protein n=1 Tax=Blumeria graminis f. sp. hordei (strain DH14) TaxID=546991 RepID=N1JBK6_BLUG1|nr:putative candidate secreted effector protein [Blumeria hordei DH14]
MKPSFMFWDKNYLVGYLKIICQYTTIGATTTLFTCALAFPDSESWFHCSKTITIPKAVEDTRIIACNNLILPDWSSEFPATLDGSDLYKIKDATLFTWPLVWDSNRNFEKVFNNSPGSEGTERVVIDSTCKLIGVIDKIGNSYQKCIQILDPRNIPPLILNLSLGNSLKHYGFDCNRYKFVKEKIHAAHVHLRQYLLDHGISDRHLATQKLLQKHKLPDFGGKTIFSWPVGLNGEKRLFSNAKSKRFRVTVDKSGHHWGMIYSSRGRWKPCLKLQYIEPEPPRSLSKYETSVGEAIFEDISAFRCEDYVYTAITINSHMQIACNQLKQLGDLGSTNKLQHSSSSLHIKQKSAWFWPLRQSEFSLSQDKNVKQHSILLGRNCEFLGAYYLSNANQLKCQKLETPMPSIGL